MCEKCNETLLAASQAALNLANAASTLYHMNQNAEATTLAKAAAELFTEVKQEGGVNGEADAVHEKAAHPAGFHLDEENGVIYFDGVAIGRIVRTGKTTQH